MQILGIFEELNSEEDKLELHYLCKARAIFLKKNCDILFFFFLTLSTL